MLAISTSTNISKVKKKNLTQKNRNVMMGYLVALYFQCSCILGAFFVWSFLFGILIDDACSGFLFYFLHVPQSKLHHQNRSIVVPK